MEQQKTLQNNAGGTDAATKRKLSSPDASALMTVSGALLVLIVFFSIQSPYFFSLKNFLNIGLYAAIMGTIACGMTFINVSGSIDISVGSVVAFVGMVVAVVGQHTTNVFLMVAAGLAAGALCGAFNGFFITVLKLNAFITTIASMQIIRGVAYLITDGQTVVISNSAFNFLGRGYIFGNTFPFTLFFMIICYIVFHFIAKYTVFGRTIYMVGGNAQASFLAGIKVNRVKFMLYVINGITAGIAGIMTAAQTGAGLPMAAININMQALSAVILGGAGLTGGRGTILGTFIGVFVLCTLNNGMTMLNVQIFWQDVVIGAVLLISVSIDAIKGGCLKRKI
ncbi:MAG TPA: ABC transporter permease [Feifaniaceae bacterium]|nr:ABC transporter permease [Feifaniaceae bacterium]